MTGLNHASVTGRIHLLYLCLFLYLSSGSEWTNTYCTGLHVGTIPGLDKNTTAFINNTCQWRMQISNIFTFFTLQQVSVGD